MATITPSKLKIKQNGASDEYLYSFEDMTGATSSNAGKKGMVPAPATGDNEKYLKGDGTWGSPVGDISAKADKVTSATNGNFAALDANGNLTDSGHKHSDYLTSHQDISGKADLASPAFTGTPTAPTANAGTNNTQIATTAYVMNAFQANDAMIFKGTIGIDGTVTSLPDEHHKGWTYKVITKGTYAGEPCEIGDMIICVTDGTVASDSDWAVVQSNIDGAVVGPDSSTADHVAAFSGTTGKVIKDSGFTIEKSVPSDAVFTDTQRSDSSIVNLIYPVGSIYMSVNSTSPATLFGGTWSQLKDRFLLGAGDTYTAGNTGGAASVSYTPAGTNSGGSVGNHTLTTTEIPSHNHTFTGSAVTSGGQSQNHTHTFTSGNQSQDHTHSTTTGNQSAGHTHTGPSHTHSVGAHSHGLNSHKHSVGAHSHGLNSHTHGVGTYTMNELGSHTHQMKENSTGTLKDFGAFSAASGTNWIGVTGTPSTGWSITSAGAHKHTISGSSAAASGSTANSSAFDSGAASGSTANSSAFDSGAAGTGNTGGISANHTHTGTSGGVSKNHTHSGTSDSANQGHTHSVTAAGTIGSTGGGGAHNHGFTNPTFTGTAATIATMPPYLAVYMWKRTA